MGGGSRRKPSSHKQKVEQLKKKKQERQERQAREDAEEGSSSSAIAQEKSLPLRGDEQHDKLVTVFAKEDKASLERRRILSREPFQRDWSMRVAHEGLYQDVIDMPVRPQWSRDMSKAQLEAQETAYFDEYIRNVYAKYPRDLLNYFEHNLEVWRQLWRVTEQADVICVVVDARYPTFHLPPSLHRFVTVVHSKPMIVVLNKIDLVPRTVLAAWADALEAQYQHTYVIPFSSFPKKSGEAALDGAEEVRLQRKREKRKYIAHGTEALLDALTDVITKRPEILDNRAG